jgi:arsenite-transporting ATPase
MALDDVDLFLRDLNERIQTVRNLIYNSAESSFALVAIPEALSVNETKRYAEELTAQGVPVTDLIINRVEEEHDKCPFCRTRVKAQKRWVSELSKHFKSLKLHRVPLRAREVRGVEALKSFGEEIWAGKEAPRKTVGEPSKGSQVHQQSKGFALDDRRVWIFGGKGGVGKTTAAASLALVLAKRAPKKRVLIFSSDPAHSLSDSFNEPIGPLKTGVGGLRNLDAMEIDPGEWFDDLKRRYRSWTNDLFDSLTSGSRLDIKFDREAMRELVELTPPGIDEIAALGVISDLIDEDKYDVIVLDTAPTGHLIRFLELPRVALDWIRTFIKLLLKYQNVVHAGKIGEELVALSKSIKRVIALLTDPKLCQFVGVSIPERMSLEETTDLAKSLKQLGVPMQRLLINCLTPDSAAVKCKFCQTRRRFQDEVVASFQHRFGKAMQLFVAPQLDRDVQAPELLLRHFDGWLQTGPNIKRTTGC